MDQWVCMSERKWTLLLQHYHHTVNARGTLYTHKQGGAEKNNGTGYFPQYVDNIIDISV